MSTNGQYEKQKTPSTLEELGVIVLEAFGIRSKVAPQRCLLSSPSAKIAFFFDNSKFSTFEI